MSMEMTLLKATIDAWAINAKREKEAIKEKFDAPNRCEWVGQEIAFKRVQELLAKAGAQ